MAPVRVPGDCELYASIDWQERGVRFTGPGLSEALALVLEDDLEALSQGLREAEWTLEGVAGAWSANVDLAAGTISFFDYRLTAIQSQNLRSLLARAQAVLASGVGEL